MLSKELVVIISRRRYSSQPCFHFLRFVGSWLQPEIWPSTVCSFYRNSASGLCSFSWLLIICMQITFFIVMWRSVAVLDWNYLTILFVYIYRTCEIKLQFLNLFQCSNIFIARDQTIRLGKWLDLKKVQCFMYELSNAGDDPLINLYKCRRLWSCKNTDFRWPCIFCKFT